MIRHHEPPSLWTTVQIISVLKRRCDTVTDFGTSFKHESSSPCWDTKCPIFWTWRSVFKSQFFEKKFFFSTWTDYMMSPRHERHHVQYIFRLHRFVRASFNHIGSLRISNIRSKSKSEYPVIKLFENAQPYSKCTNYSSTGNKYLGAVRLEIPMECDASTCICCPGTCISFHFVTTKKGWHQNSMIIIT